MYIIVVIISIIIISSSSSSEEVRQRRAVSEEDWEVLDAGEEDAVPLLQDSAGPQQRSELTGRPTTAAVAGQRQEDRKLSVLDIFRHRRLRFTTLVVWVAW